MVGFGWFWFVLVGFGWFWLVLVGFGWFWLVFVGFGWFWLVLVGIVWFWLVLVGFGWFQSGSYITAICLNFLTHFNPKTPRHRPTPSSDQPTRRRLESGGNLHMFLDAFKLSLDSAFLEADNHSSRLHKERVQ